MQHTGMPAAMATDPPAPAASPMEAKKLEHILNNALGPLSGPGPHFVTKECLTEMDAEHTTAYTSDGTAISVWKANLHKAPPKNAVIVTTEITPNNTLPRLDEQNV